MSNESWFHIDGGDPDASEILRSHGIDDDAVTMMLADETRPRRVCFDKGDVIILRGVNLNPGAAPEDMISLRVWLTERLLVTVGLRRLKAVDLEQGRQNRHPGEMAPPDRFLALAAAMIDELKEVVRVSEDELETAEEQILEAFDAQAFDRLRTLRRRAISLRRFVQPQLQALIDLERDPPSWLSQSRLMRLRELINSSERILDALTATREHIGAVQDQLTTALSEKTRRTNQSLVLIATIFLPLNLIAALLGMNVGGIPLADSTRGFWVILAIFAVGLIPALYFIWRDWWSR